MKEKIKCLDCIKVKNTCCAGNCSRFITLHDLLRLQKLGYDIDSISSFEKMVDWEIKHKQDEVHAGFYDLDVDQKLLMLKKGEKNVFFWTIIIFVRFIQSEFYFAKFFLSGLKKLMVKSRLYLILMPATVRFPRLR